MKLLHNLVTVSSLLLCSADAFAQSSGKVQIIYGGKLTYVASGKIGSNPRRLTCVFERKVTIFGGNIFEEPLKVSCSDGSMHVSEGQGNIYLINNTTSEVVNCQQRAKSSRVDCDDGTNHSLANADRLRTNAIRTLTSNYSAKSLELKESYVDSGSGLSLESNKPFSFEGATEIKIKFKLDDSSCSFQSYSFNMKTKGTFKI